MAKRQRFENLTEFPMSVLDDVGRTQLSLYGAFDYRAKVRIPDAIAKLSQLRSFVIGMCNLQELPEAFAKLAKLEKLDLDYAEKLERLPNGLGKLRALREVHLRYTPRLKSLPESIGGCTSLEELACEPGGLTSVPASLWRCKKLRVLTLPASVKRLPKGISALTNLEMLEVCPDALASIREELPSLVSLKKLRLWGKGARLPDEIGSLGSLSELEILYSEKFTALPSTITALRNLKRLDVSGNALTELRSIVSALPKLKALEYGENKLPLAERRALEAMMKLPPNRRGSVKAAPKAPPIAKPRLLGEVASINAYLAMLLVDAEHAPAWVGIGDTSDDDEIAKSDWSRFRKVVGKKLGAPIRVGRGLGLAVAPSIGQGVSHVFKTSNGLALVESFVDELEDRLFLEWIASTPAGAKSVGTLEVATGALVITPSTDGCADVAKLAAKRGKDAIECGSNDSSLLVRMPPGRYEVLVEKEVERSFGSARRTIVRAAATA